MRVLLATDGSGGAAAALDVLTGFPFPAGSEAIVLSVIDGKTFDESRALTDEQTRTIRETRDVIREETEQFLGGEGERLREAGWAGIYRPLPIPHRRRQLPPLAAVNHPLNVDRKSVV